MAAERTPVYPVGTTFRFDFGEFSVDGRKPYQVFWTFERTAGLMIAFDQTKQQAHLQALSETAEAPFSFWTWSALELWPTVPGEFRYTAEVWFRHPHEHKGVKREFRRKFLVVAPLVEKDCMQARVMTKPDVQVYDSQYKQRERAGTWLSFGRDWEDHAGIRFTARVKSGDCAGGKLAFLQTMCGKTSCWASDSAEDKPITHDTRGQWVVDAPDSQGLNVQNMCWALDKSFTEMRFVVDGNKKLKYCVDTPAIRLVRDGRKVEMNQQFRCYLAYQAAGFTRWVTLGYVPWYWHAVAQQKDGVWTCTAARWSSEKELEFVPSTEQPTWKCEYTSLGQDIESLWGDNPPPKSSSSTNCLVM